MTLPPGCIVFAWSLYGFFANRQLDIELDPLHSDGVCGLRRIAYISTLQAIILFLLGIYLSLKVIDKSLIQEISIYSDIGNPVMLGSYALLAPLIFFLPMSSAHRLMQKTRDPFLQRLTRKTWQMIDEADHTDDVCKSAECFKLVKDLEKLHSKFSGKIPVWPFNVRTLQGFFGSVLVPLIQLMNKGVRALYFSGRRFSSAKGLLLAVISTGERAALSCYKKMEEDSGAAWYLGLHFNKFPQRHLHQGQ